uniref:Uncharacterized protein n=1 Tax=Arundo donax TaxID=35708 RepID=A0A0A9FTU6_ARUDO
MFVRTSIKYNSSVQDIFLQLSVFLRPLQCA